MSTRQSFANSYVFYPGEREDALSVFEYKPTSYIARDEFSLVLPHFQIQWV